MRKGLRIALVAVGAIVIGSAMARGLPHHAAAPAPPPPSSGGSGSQVWGTIFPTLIVGALIWLAIHLNHRRKLRELDLREAELDGFVSVKRAQLGDLWRCPDCHCLIMLADIDDHQEESACAQYQRWLEQSDAAGEEIEPPAFTAEQVAAGETLSATLPPEHSVTSGDYDSIEGG